MSITGHLRTRTDIYINKIKWHIIEKEVMVVEEVTEYVNVEHIEEDIVDGIVDEGINLFLYFVAYVQQHAVLRLQGGFTAERARINAEAARKLRMRRNYLAHRRYVDRNIREINRKTYDPRDDEILKRGINKLMRAKEHITAKQLSAIAGASIYTGYSKFPRLRGKTAPPPDWPGQGDDIPEPDVYQRQLIDRTRKIIIQENNMDINRNAGGYNMLDWKNSLTRKYQSRLIYHMSLVKKTKTLDEKQYHYTDIGQGPCLYGTYITNKSIVDSANVTIRDTDFGIANPLDSGLDGDYRGVGLWNIVYVFAADWPFQAMNHDPNTQLVSKRQYGLYLAWGYKGLIATTDPNLPRTAQFVIRNKDWQYFTHYYTVYTFDMQNTSHMPYVVEILFFKFKADPDTMNYQRQVEAVMGKQKTSVTDYINNALPAPQDITVLHKKRIYLKGMENYGLMATTLTTDAGKWSVRPNSNRENSKRYKFVVKRKYVIRRPILNDYNDMGEFEFFNTYYEKDKGIYCRIQAFSMEADFLIPEGTTDPTPTIRTNEDTHNMKEEDTCTKLMFGVEMRMHKQSRWKLDENVYKGTL